MSSSAAAAWCPQREVEIVAETPPGGDVKAPRIRVFDSALDAIADVVGGKADVCAVTAASAVKEIAAGTMRELAISAPQRLAGLYASTPTWIEQSVDCMVGAWREWRAWPRTRACHVLGRGACGCRRNEGVACRA